ncbi:hypothetical protein GJ496_011663 [Pomphorhynchus laevis]|nr:hypothetical protein GJ496_011663 [Pomphorhynchus laevis]
MNIILNSKTVLNRILIILISLLIIWTVLIFVMVCFWRVKTKEHKLSGFWNTRDRRKVKSGGNEMNARGSEDIKENTMVLANDSFD